MRAEGRGESGCREGRYNLHNHQQKSNMINPTMGTTNARLTSFYSSERGWVSLGGLEVASIVADRAYEEKGDPAHDIPQNLRNDITKPDKCLRHC